jgi:hypothetical protein
MPRRYIKIHKIMNIQKELYNLFYILVIKKTDNGLLQFFRYLIAGGTASLVA